MHDTNFVFCHPLQKSSFLLFVLNLFLSFSLACTVYVCFLFAHLPCKKKYPNLSGFVCVQTKDKCAGGTANYKSVRIPRLFSRPVYFRAAPPPPCFLSPLPLPARYAAISKLLPGAAGRPPPPPPRMLFIGFDFCRSSNSARISGSTELLVDKTRDSK